MGELKKGISRFHLVGEVSLKDDSFSLNQKSSKNQSYIFSTLNLGIDCGSNDSNLIFTKLMGGYDTTKDTYIYCHGVKEDNGKVVDDFDNQIKVKFADREEDRNDIAQSCYITVAIVKDINDKVVERKFLSEYDVINYLHENLKSGMVVSVRGNLSYKQYQGKTQVERKITSIWVSSAKKEDFRATFEQTVLLTQDSFGDLEDNGYLPVYSHVVDYYNKEIKNVCYPFTFNIDTNKLKKYEAIIKTYLRPAKQDGVNKVVIEGIWTKTDNTVTVKFEDLSDDLKDMVDLGMLSEEEALGRAIGSERGEFKTVLKSICTRKDKDTGAVTLLIDKENVKVEDIVLPPQETKTEEILEQVGKQTETKKETKDNENDDELFKDLFDL